MAQHKSGLFINQHKASYNDIVLTLLEIIFCGMFFNMVSFSDIQKFFSRFWFSLKSQFRFGDSKAWEEKKNQDPCSSLDSNTRDDTDRNLCRKEVEMVMGKLGLFCSPESEELKESLGSDELSQLFDEKEPSLEEVKEAFDVFDVNRDGFIDAEELRRTLQILGLKEGFELENCRKMIRACDGNRDGKIDFNEFVKFMENSFY